MVDTAQIYFRLGIIGHDEGVLTQLQSIVDKWSCHCSLVSLDLSLPTPSWPQVDAFLIVPQQDEENFLQKILARLRWPLTAKNVVLLSFQENYQSLLYAMRLGIKDVIHYPFLSEEVVTVLSHVWGHTTLSKQIMHWERTVHEWPQLVLCEGEQNGLDHYFGYLQKLLSEHYPARDLYFLQMNERQEFEHLYSQGPHPQAAFFVRTLTAFFQNQWQDLSADFAAKKGPHLYEVGEGVKLFYLGTQVNAEEEVMSAPASYWLAIGTHVQAGTEVELAGSLAWSLAHFFFFSYQLFTQQSQQKYLGRLALTDDVTGLYNQRCLRRDLEHLISAPTKDVAPFVLLFIDIDHFKSINDQNGHLTGSLILSEMGKRLRKMLRETDTIYRYGGDEFVVILPQTDKERGYEVGQRILKGLELGPFYVQTAKEKKTIYLSVSIGVAEYPGDGESTELLMEMADDLLYEAKNTGRGRVCFIQTGRAEEQSRPQSQKDGSYPRPRVEK